jgi:exopolysaccharide biosynthesis polyprenyl glycosylphosphotransferase
MECDAVVILNCPEVDGPALRELSWRLHEQGIDLAIVPVLVGVAAERILVDTVDGLPLMHIRAPILSGPVRAIKEAVERVIAAAALLLLSPLMLALAVTVRLTSTGPAFFRQVRVGLNGAEFVCLKFRTMVADAERLRDQLEHLNEKSDGVLFKIRRDPRITKVGRILRKCSLDELPQLINVLRGEMSLVGPRPPLPEEVAQYTDEVRHRLAVKPGITGLWQVSGRSMLSWDESVRLDLSYVENWSPQLDAKILLRTTSAVVRGTGAF